MALQAQNQNQLMEVATALRRRLGQVLAPAAVLISLGVLASGLMPRKFTAYTALEVRDVPLPFSGQGGMDTTAIVRDVTATPWQIKQYERVRRVIEKLEWPEYTALSPMEQNDFVRKQIDAIGLTPAGTKNAAGSSLIGISYKCDDPQRAEQFLNRLRDAYTQEVLERYRNDARRNLEVLRNTMSAASDELKKRNEERARPAQDEVIGGESKREGGPEVLRRRGVGAAREAASLPLFRGGVRRDPDAPSPPPPKTCFDYLFPKPAPKKGGGGEGLRSLVGE